MIQLKSISLEAREKLNAIREQTATELLTAISDAEADVSIKLILIKGIEKAFCTGVDTSEFKQDPEGLLARADKWKEENDIA